MAGERAWAFGEHLSEALVDHLIERAGPTGAFVLGAFLAASEGAVRGAAHTVGLSFRIEARFAIGLASERSEGNARAEFIAALYAACAQRIEWVGRVRRDGRHGRWRGDRRRHRRGG